MSILAPIICDSNILDLFAGTGALGLEGVSRGGASAVFIDSGATSLSLLKKNIMALEKYLGKKAPCTIIKHDLRKGLGRFVNGFCNQLKMQEKFDIIFLDPPYDKGLALYTLQQLDQNNFLTKDGLIIAEERTKTKLPKNLETLTLHDQRNYGDTGFWIYNKK